MGKTVNKFVAEPFNTRTWVPVKKSSSYPETVEVECEPTGTTAIQCHHIIKIED